MNYLLIFCFLCLFLSISSIGMPTISRSIIMKHAKQTIQLLGKSYESRNSIIENTGINIKDITYRIPNATFKGTLEGILAFIPSFVFVSVGKLTLIHHMIIV